VPGGAGAGCKRLLRSAHAWGASEAGLGATRLYGSEEAAKTEVQRLVAQGRQQEAVKVWMPLDCMEVRGLQRERCSALWRGAGSRRLLRSAHACGAAVVQGDELCTRTPERCAQVAVGAQLLGLAMWLNMPWVARTPHPCTRTHPAHTPLGAARRWLWARSCGGWPSALPRRAGSRW